jgi:hypothetical protein
MVADPLDLPKGALKSVDALVAKSDGPHAVWAAVHFLLNIAGDTPRDRTVPAGPVPRSGGTATCKRKKQSRISGPDNEKFLAELWSSSRNGTVQF